VTGATLDPALLLALIDSARCLIESARRMYLAELWSSRAASTESL
jgi:hypothetical protein